MSPLLDKGAGAGSAQPPVGWSGPVELAQRHLEADGCPLSTNRCAALFAELRAEMRRVDQLEQQQRKMVRDAEQKKFG